MPTCRATEVLSKPLCPAETLGMSTSLLGQLVPQKPVRDHQASSAPGSLQRDRGLNRSSGYHEKSLFPTRMFCSKEAMVNRNESHKHQR